MNVYFTCVFCSKSLATDETNAIAKATCPDCGKPLVLPVTTVRCKCQHCHAPMATIKSMLNQRIQCLECKKLTLLVETVGSNSHTDPIPEPFNIAPLITPKFQIKRRKMSRKFNYYGHIPLYIHVNIAIAIALAVARIFFHDTIIERVFIYAFQISIVASCILEAYLFYIIQCINKKGINENIIESQQIKDILSWKRFYSSPINAVLWNFIIFLPMLIFFTIDFKWFVVILLIIYQVCKSLIAFNINEISEATIKYRKNQTIENIKKETGVQSFTDEKDGEKVEI